MAEIGDEYPDSERGEGIPRLAGVRKCNPELDQIQGNLGIR
jgi:hypothetical protein